MPTAYLIHGTSTRDADWFPWLEQAAGPEIKVVRLSLPNPYEPQQDEWNAAVDRQIPAKDGLTLIAHSLGCVTALRFVQRHQLKDVKLLLVAAFDKPLPTYPELDAFMQPKPNYEQILPKLSQSTVITALDDPIAPWDFAADVARQLYAKLITRKHGGHFLASDGYEQFPLVLKELKQMTKA